MAAAAVVGEVAVVVVAPGAVWLHAGGWNFAVNYSGIAKESWKLAGKSDPCIFSVIF